MSTQCDVVPVSIKKFMSNPLFERGVREVRSGRRFDWRVDALEYEAGRQFAVIAPIDMPIRINGKLNPKAVSLLMAASKRKLIL